MSIIPILHMMKKSQKEREERYKKQQEEINKRFVRVATPHPLRVRKKPSLNSQILTLLVRDHKQFVDAYTKNYAYDVYHNKAYEFVEYNANHSWMKIIYDPINKKEGWVYSAYVAFTKVLNN